MTSAKPEPKPDAHAAEFRLALARLAGAFPDVPVEVVERSLTDALERTAGAAIDTYRMLLAERSARSMLRARGKTGPSDAV